jgi:hypothetical protein
LPCPRDARPPALAKEEEEEEEEEDLDLDLDALTCALPPAFDAPRLAASVRDLIVRPDVAPFLLRVRRLPVDPVDDTDDATRRRLRRVVEGAPPSLV